MTLDLSNRAWIRRIESSAEDRRDRFRDYTDRIRRYVGPGHRGGEDWRQMGGWDPINQAFNAISTWAPQLAFGNPRFRVGSERDESESDAKKGEAALNRLAVQSKMRQLLEALTVDFWLDFAVCLTTQEPQPGFSDWDDPPHWPTNTRIAPWEFVYDSDQYAIDRWRYQGHEVVRDQNDLLAEAKAKPDLGWNEDVIRSIQAGIVEKPREAKGGRDNPENREQIKYTQVYCPEATAEDLRKLGVKLGDTDDQGRPYTPAGGYHGALFWIAKDAGQVVRDQRGRFKREDGDSFIREPSMYWGPRGGPYTVWTGYFIPNDPLGLAPDVATLAQTEAANDVARAILRAISRGKNIGLVSSADTELQDAIDSAIDGDVRTLRDVPDDIKKRVVEMKLGGVYPELMVAGEWTLDLLQMASGMGDAQRGETRQGVTATATAAASIASSTKIGFLALKGREFTGEIGRKDLWFLLMDERSVVRLEDGTIFVGGKKQSVGLRQAARIEPALEQAVEQQIFQATGQRRSFQEIISILEGEEGQEEEALDQDDEIDRMSLTVEPFSMERTTEGMQQHQFTVTMGTLERLVPLTAQFPFMRWKRIYRQVGDMSNIPDLDSYLDEEKLTAFQSMLMQSQMAPETQPPPKPNIARNAGAGPSGTPKAKAQATGTTMKPTQPPKLGNKTGALAGAASKST